MAEWIESSDLEAMTSYNREIGVRGPVGTSSAVVFSPGVHTHGFSPLDKPQVFLAQSKNSSKFQICKTRVWPDVRTSVPTPLCW